MRPALLRCLFVGLIACAATLVGRPLRAEPALVVLVRPPARSALVDEAMTRIRGELVADGFDVRIVDAPPGASTVSVLAHADQGPSAAATLGLFLHADAKIAEVWVVDRLTNKTVMRSIEMPASSTGSAPEVLARRSVELLRASLLEILVDARERPVESPDARVNASQWAAKALEPRPSRWGFEAGALVLKGFGGVGGALMPVARVRFVFERRLAARVTLAGLGTRPLVESPYGSASVRQELGLLELVGEIAPESRLRPALSVGAGTYHLGVDGSAAWPYAGLEDNRFVFAADAGAGLSLSFTASFAVALEGHATLVTPYPVIRFLEMDTAEIRNPLLSAVLTLMVRL
jgi:hypothetical protein